MELDLFCEAHEGHRDRIRQRLLREGIDSLKPHEIIEFLLYYALPRQDVNALAHDLIDSFGDVRGVLMAELPELRRVPGLGRRAAEWLALVGELVLAADSLRAEDDRRIACFRDLFSLACDIGRELDAPCTVQLCVDAGDRLISRCVLTPSLSWGEPDVLREGLADALESEAAGVLLLLLAGDRSSAPGEYDIAHARDYARLLHYADCTLHDVVIMNRWDMTSMRQLDLVPEYPSEGRRTLLRENYAASIPDLALLDLAALRYMGWNDDPQNNL